MNEKQINAIKMKVKFTRLHTCYIVNVRVIMIWQSQFKTALTGNKFDQLDLVYPS